MEETDVVILGGGLTSLTLANILTKLHISFVILEARDRLGGRIHTVTAEDGARVEMGATWYFPFFKNLLNLLKDNGVKLKPQFASGKMMYEGYGGEMSSQREEEGDDMFRMVGGTAAIIESLYEKIDKSKVKLGQIVKKVETSEEGVEVTTQEMRVKGRRVVSTIPPQLLVNSVEFTPSLPSEVVYVAKHTHTWMGESSKCAITYATPFWRERGMSGTLYSGKGPIAQMYDQSDNKGRDKYALAGFMTGAAEDLSKEERKKKVIGQLVKVFGEEANNYTDYHDTVWREDRFTMPENSPSLGHHKNNGNEVYQRSYFGGKLYIGGTETSVRNPGYMEGAVVSAKNLAERIKDDTRRFNMKKTEASIVGSRQEL